MERLDLALTSRLLAPTRTKAQGLIKNGKVLLNGKTETKAKTLVDELDKIEVLENETLKFVSRAGLKLEKAMNVFNLNFKNKTVLDIGSSTGGFTDCALQNSEKKVIACDVGTQVMHIDLRNSPKIELHEKTNIKNLESSCFKGLDFIVCDVSFTSLKTIFFFFANEKIACPCMMLIKPQFECGMEIAKKFKGVIKNKTVHLEVLKNVVSFANSFGFYLQKLDVSPIKGGDGNIEYISLFSPISKQNEVLNFEKIVDFAFEIK